MSGGLLLASTERPATVYGVHGAAGRTNWTCFARRPGLRGTWEAIEWASVPPGGVSGEHRHTRTEEIYFLISGEADFVLDGKAHRMTPGWLGLTRVGSRHALHNVGTDRVDWLVIEMFSPATARVLGERVPSGEGETVDSGKASTVVNLGERGEFDPRTVFDGPLASIKIQRLAPGTSLGVVSDTCEHTLFVLSGSGTCVTDDQRVTVGEGSSVTLPLEGAMRVEAGDAGLELFHATMDVPGAVA